METAALHCEDWASILCGANGDTTRLKEKLAKLEEEVKRLKAIEKEMLAAPDQQVSPFTDPDSLLNGNQRARLWYGRLQRASGRRYDEPSDRRA